MENGTAASRQHGSPETAARIDGLTIRSCPVSPLPKRFRRARYALSSPETDGSVSTGVYTGVAVLDGCWFHEEGDDAEFGEWVTHPASSVLWVEWR